MLCPILTELLLEISAFLFKPRHFHRLRHLNTAVRAEQATIPALDAFFVNKERSISRTISKSYVRIT